ncbi:hypothetical protein AGMMS49965_10250 [Bacteroidia bacterium]|nr:hypothetical protein AGMMS49965_10250 [Bacteroidia bacterium]
MKIQIINGPNLNLLGVREPGVYGSESFAGYFESLQKQYPSIELTCYQSNVEGEIINKIHEVGFSFDGIVLNAGGYTHTSVAIHDAIKAVSSPVVEVHISNVHAREDYRHLSLITAVCKGVIAGFGLNSYQLAIESLAKNTPQQLNAPNRMRNEANPTTPVGLAADHAGYELKEFIRTLLEKRNIPHIDYGTNTTESVNYPDYGHKLARAIESNEVERGIAVCSTGNGINMTLNRHPAIRSALCWNEETARLARQHNNANVMALPGRFIATALAEKMTDIFLNTPFEGGRHQLRVESI